MKIHINIYLYIRAIWNCLEIFYGIPSSMTNKYALLSLWHNELRHLITLLVAE